MPTESAERERIIKAAYRCLAEVGGAGASVGEILRTAGLGTRAFYRHFDSKDDLLLAMFRRDSERLLTELQSAAASAATPVEALQGWVEAMLRLTSEARRRQHVRILSSEGAQRTAGYAAERARVAAGQEAALAQILHRGRQDGSFPWAEPESDARFIRAVIAQAFDEQMAPTASMSATEAAARVRDFVLRALGATTTVAAAGRQERP
ncbi:TetR/AcrR family transcriptional regulator [Streptomyces iranensis]|uniref:TetR/AcrR family transcriptional regulator n=1 Tax=Streptomyces iranensis TaxID=576784 RepID=UPI0039B73C99